jgi:hypothetical protein
MNAAHIGIQRPAEGHPFHPIQRAPARLFAILDAHPHMIEHMFVPTEVAPGVVRVHIPDADGSGHVHGYLLAVDGRLPPGRHGPRSPDLAERWAELGPRLDLARWRRS